MSTIPLTPMKSHVSLTPSLRSEWWKIVSVRGQWVALAAVFLATLGFSLLMSGTFTAEQLAAPEFDPLRSAYYGLNFGGIGAVSFGAMAAAGEYKSGAIRLSLAAVPHRGVFYTAKLAVIGALALVVGLATSLTCFLIGQALMDEYGVGLGDPGALRSVLGCGIYLALITLFAAGLTMVARSAPAVIGTLIPFLMMMSFVIGDLDDDGGIAEFLPDRAGQQILLQDPTGPLSPWAGLGVLALWTGAALWAGWVALRRRDA
ncbi:ABC transporter permease [Streptomyces albipurpureus]|uniref:ABC transporter permease n=1 Tax=Streptomyces albipurpureus TaxID=2897419 RepID=A0ABT0UU75_9ACTN|nr:ABC transporter permease [Streptomyces sp. CWNU-1]MCM2392137.1 ABC transporter permease [Streptomyces sp. CWNU-1]